MAELGLAEVLSGSADGIVVDGDKFAAGVKAYGGSLP